MVTETAKNCTIEDCDFIGDRPTVRTSAENTKLIRVRHFAKEVKEHPARAILFTGIIISVISLIIEYVFFA